MSCCRKTLLLMQPSWQQKEQGMKSVHTGPAALTELQNFQKNILMQREKLRDTAVNMEESI